MVVSHEKNSSASSVEPVKDEGDLKRRMEELCKLRAKVQSEECALMEFQIRERMALLKRLYGMMIDKYDKEVSRLVTFNDGLLYAAVKSYYDDIYRFKSYSNSAWADSHKQAGYTIKWLVKFRPIQINYLEAPMPNVLFKINAVYAIFVGLSLLGVEAQNRITPKYYDHLIYTLTFRNLSGKQLASLFYLLECNAKSELPQVEDFDESECDYSGDEGGSVRQ